MPDLPFPWNIYEDNQKKLNRSYRITDRTWSIESGLAKLLTAVESGGISADQEVKNSVDRAIASAFWTERNRARLRRKYLPPVPELDPEPQRHPSAFSSCESEARMLARVRLLEIRRRVSSDEWWLIIGAASGYTCNELAEGSSATPGAIRTKLSRLRSQLKMAA
jgi:hypothetical protein